ncbi:cleft lip and palate transmembrane protein 1-domain-containing protein [Fimicolochytrium jonesii]|uniref:cleft lip and palate transmembrane protein 1-domain-containing protein n=1 Tax=Fimicolochytrium jonesii TaxID=1396493 RepID=UPI0022FEA587|nr:cleft lip and palate transmembrane protein 1-domain-containing protein [Fimicolochytrium jonesii]KAI8825115.1 cleft lip and palate transmembrane protein 1-domain-containing protein [Fimicolochytrium jonesii]
MSAPAAPAAAAAAPGGAPNAQQAGGGGFYSIATSIGRILLISYAVNAVGRAFKGNQETADVVQGSAPTGQDGPVPAAHQVHVQTRTLQPSWLPGDRATLSAFLTETENFNPDATPVWEEKDIFFGEWKGRTKEVTIDVPESVQRNGSLYAHFILNPTGNVERQPEEPAPSPLYSRKLLTRFMPKRKVKKTKKLVASEGSLADPEPEEEQEDGQVPIISYWWPNVTLNVLNHVAPLPPTTPPLMLKNFGLESDGVHYKPPFYVNDFWLTADQLSPINETVKTLNLSLSYNPVSYFKYQVFTGLEENLRVQQTTLGVAAAETDDMKRMFMDTNPYLLGVTMFVSMLHSIFDILAFKNDIQFWRKRKDMEGLSFRAITMNVAFQAVIFLYLLDNDTSWMIIISTGVGLLIEIWKIQKTVIVQRKPEFPYVEFVDRVKPSKLASKTKKYDEMAFKYVSRALYPCLAAYAIYSLVYEEHKGWYSYIIGTLVGFVYAFGFITMTPQLFVNYKLKSVAHMPWKTFMYKALNTFVDDLFAFVIKMPWLHRLACLRDDVVFFVYLYQRWVYREDKRRRNEFGQVGEDDRTRRSPRQQASSTPTSAAPSSGTRSRKMRFDYAVINQNWPML